ncbi:MAG: hypothetical protein OHK0039_18730 [Bacteroidia bacterium]
MFVFLHVMKKIFAPMKAQVFISLLLTLPLLVSGQAFDYGNAWYSSNPNRTFVKLLVEVDGLYRVSAQDLLAAGYDLSQVSPRNVQLYYRGKEQPVYVASAGGSIQYIEFYGRRNDGRLDSVMYRDPVTGLHKSDLQPDILTSLYTDVSAYFLTWASTPSAFRFFSVFDPTYSLYTPEAAVRYESRVRYAPGMPGSNYVLGGGGAYDAFYTLNSDYVTGEGYMGPDFKLGTPRTIRIETPHPANNGSAVRFQMRVFGRSNTQHGLRVDYNGNSSHVVLDTTWLTNAVYTRTYVRDFVTPTAMQASTDLTFNALRGSTDNNNICWVSATYDRLPIADGDSAFVVSGAANAAKTYYRLQQVTGQDTVYVLDLANRIRYKGLITTSGGVKSANVVVLGATQPRDLYFFTDAAVRKPTIAPAALGTLHRTNQGADFIIIAHRGLSASAEAYARYRDTATVHDLSARVVYTDEIYDEFGYGSVTPWAIKRFCKYSLDKWTTRPKYFLLWGKGKYATRGHEALTMVPTYGYPATDYEFVGHFDPFSTDMNIEAAIGRVNIFSDTEGFSYLAKIAEYEHQAWEPWMKEAVFLGGGGTEAEQNSISSAFRFMQSVFEGRPFGGWDYYFQKNSSSIIIDPTTATYHDEIDAGVHLIHFFGHSTQNILDISIRQPNEYINYGRYPLMIAMGCYGGDFTVSEASFGERWVKEPGRGSIGYLANSSAGYLNPLWDYGQVLYTRLFDRRLGEPLGDILRETINAYTDSLVGIQYRNHGRQMNLQGDPAVKLYNTPSADLEITEPSIYFTPDNFSAQDDSFRVHIIVQNNGMVVGDSFAIEVRQRLPGGGTIEHSTFTEPMVHYRDTFAYVLKNPVGNEMAGLNVFEIYVDARNELDELRENNNRVTLSRLVPGNIPAILYPQEYAIVANNRVSLQASALFMTRDADVGYVFEVDTTARFNSPLRTSSGVVTGAATFVSWEIPFTLRDSTVYFWRVRLADVTPVTWANASFEYIENRTGWGQSTLKQFEKAALRDLTYDELQQEWKFGVYGAEYEFSTRKGGSFFYSVNGSLVADLDLNDGSGTLRNAAAYVILDQYTLEPIINTYFIGPIGVAKAPGELYRLRDAILNARHGDYVIVASHFNPRVPQWTEDVFDALALIGASDNIRLLRDGDAFVILGRKGYPGSATEVFTANSGDKYSITSVLLSNYTQGGVISTLAGPAVSWDEMWWNWRSQDVVVQESATVTVRGVRRDGSDSLLYQRVPAGTYDLAALDAAQFPYVRLEAELVDTIRRTAPQLDNWRILYTPAPDAVVDPLTNFEFRADTIYEGQDVFLRMGARNISSRSMDSVDVRFSLELADRSRLVLDSLRIPPLLANGPSVPFEYSFSSFNKNLEGPVTMIVELNPHQTQPEQHYFNNLYLQPFYVVVDRLNPIMDVTFDGKHILNGDIVSPTPEIVVEVNDENTIVANDDTSAFTLHFFPGTFCSGCNSRVFVEGNPQVRWEPASLPDNKARLYFYPGQAEPLADGEYTLRVQGQDKNGNAAGKGENFYEIRFTVENKSTISQVLNYPNPFSTSTRFVYTLTGSELPEVFQIHIYTISGKLIKIVDLKAMGDVQFGRNITDYAWDGTDEYGDRLANGVYLYRVVMRMASGQNPEDRDEGIDRYFNNGWGKMYLMR